MGFQNNSDLTWQPGNWLLLYHAAYRILHWYLQYELSGRIKNTGIQEWRDLGPRDLGPPDGQPVFAQLNPIFTFAGPPCFPIGEASGTTIYSVISCPSQYLLYANTVLKLSPQALKAPLPPAGSFSLISLRRFDVYLSLLAFNYLQWWPHMPLYIGMHQEPLMFSVLVISS